MLSSWILFCIAAWKYAFPNISMKIVFFSLWCPTTCIVLINDCLKSDTAGFQPKMASSSILGISEKCYCLSSHSLRNIDLGFCLKETIKAWSIPLIKACNTNCFHGDFHLRWCRLFRPCVFSDCNLNWILCKFAAFSSVWRLSEGFQRTIEAFTE